MNGSLCRWFLCSATTAALTLASAGCIGKRRPAPQPKSEAKPVEQPAPKSDAPAARRAKEAPAKAAAPQPRAAAGKPQDRNFGTPQPSVNYAIPVGTDRPTRGPGDALVTIVAFQDYTEPKGKAAAATLDALKTEDPAVRQVIRSAPKSTATSRIIARTLLAAAGQGKFWEFRQALVDFKGNIAGFPQIQNLARSAGVDPTPLREQMNDPSIRAAVQADEALLSRFADLPGAPVFFVNGRYLAGDIDLPKLQQLIAQERTKAQAFMNANQTTPQGLFEAMRKTWRGYAVAEQAERNLALE